MTEAPTRVSAPQDRALAVAFCAGRDVPCPGCGYNLRDSADGVCPECGRPLVVRVDDPQPDRRAALWIAAAWCGAIGLGGVATEALMWYLAGGRPRPYTLLDGVQTALLAAMLIYGVLCVIVLLRTRKAGSRVARAWTRVGWSLWGALVASGVWMYAKLIIMSLAGAMSILSR